MSVNTGQTSQLMVEFRETMFQSSQTEEGEGGRKILKATETLIRKTEAEHGPPLPSSRSLSEIGDPTLFLVHQ